MTLDIVFAGRGAVGMVIVCASSFVHLCLAIWFMYMAFAYHALPDPSWFPNTTGIGVSAVKLWLYHPMCGHFLMAVRVARLLSCVLSCALLFLTLLCLADIIVI